ncbi:amino acid ABC transporter substrate-binding protein, PAAT family [Thermanaeromonas toyohensis ToBE]|uniref:Amino acid ABC transporter substrate-binding protein, PAAT family n=1 Tax=Thermanaeromonas toyohensis ToBE TaxID=698762 RepID=A0A1W1W2Z9_9FIRM|nr:basic amino acid ABC transporter substrate-binding protein [Thermanaeromonas toyohensis]SMB99966.1 amino acid ABC transporter substrate-binding protein, PAAT family [Thermanaeromonas toyohensis ToBE]
MKTFLRNIIFLAAAIVLAVAIVGCGQSSSKKGANKEGSDKQQSQSKPKYVVATEASFAPFEFRDDKTGQYVGFDIELMKALAEVQGFDVEFKDMGFDGIIAAVKTGNVDMAISAISIDDDRKQQVDFSLPYYQSGLSVAVRADNNTIKGFQDLKGKRIAVQIGTTGAKYVKNNIEGAQVTEYNTVNDAFMELINGGVDAFVNDYPVSLYFIKQGNTKVKIVGDLANSEFYGIAIPKGKAELLQKVNEGLKKLKESGKYSEIYRKWFGENPPDFLPGEPPNKP